MSNIGAALPSLAGIEDNNVRLALQGLYDSWRVRNGEVGDGSKKFLTASDLESGLQAVNIQNLTPENVSGYMSWVTSMLQTVDNYIRQSRLWKDLNSEIDLIVNHLDANTAAITAEQTARMNGDSALTQTINTQVAAINGNIGALQTSYSNLATTTGANSSAITSLQTTVSGVNSTAQSALSLAQTTSNSVTGSWTVKFNSNGYAVGVGLGLEGKNGSYTSQFIVVADKFAVARPDGTNPIPVLEMGNVNGVDVLGFKGVLVGASGVFTGNLSASGGTFRGELAAATGTFSGKLLAGVVDMSSLVGSSYTFGTPGWQTLYVPEGYTSMRVTALGAGGGGGSASYGEWNTTRARGGGGLAGAYVIQAWDNLVAGATISIYVGNAGLGATEWQQAGYNGEATFVNYNGTRLVTAAGGAGGGFAADYDNANAAIATGKAPVNGWGTGGAPGLVGDGNYGSPVWTAGFNASGYGAGGGGGGNSGRQGAYAGGSPDKYNQWAGGGKGSGGRIIVEFYNPNAVVLRTEFTALQNRVAALEAR